MSIITRQDSNGVKPLLQTGELGYDNYPAGNDVGRVWVGTGTTNIALAKKVEVTAVDDKANIHIARVDNPHGVTATQVGLGNVDNTSDANKPISTAVQTALDLKANAHNATLTGAPTAPTATVGTSNTVLATTAFVNAEIANDTYSKTQLDGGQLNSIYYTKANLDGGQLDNRYYTETELLNGALDVRYYTEAEIDAKLNAQNDASEIGYSNATSGLVATKVQGAIDEVEGRLDVAETKIANANISRADKYLASQNVVRMIYNLDGKLSKVRYNNNSDVDYEVLTYNTDGKLSNVGHYVSSVLKGNTVLSYENGKLVSAPYIAI